MREVLIIADPHIPVPPIKYGGTERIAGTVAKAAAEAGYRVTVMGAPGSAGPWKTVAYSPPDNRRFVSRAAKKIAFQFRSLYHARKASAVITFCRTDYLVALLKTGKPLIVTYHNPIDPAEVTFVTRHRREGLALVSVSDRQRAHLATGPWHTIHNCVDPELFPLGDGSGGYLAFLGRLTKEKGVHRAIEIARQSGHRLLIAGNIPQIDGARAYFDAEIAPHLGDAIIWIGEVDHTAKVELLTGAKALLFPIKWPEPFGIVMAEAMICGTPVIALDHGAAAEVVDEGVSGFVCKSIGEMAEAAGRIDAINRAECRRICEERYSVTAIAEQYLDLISRACHER